MLKRLLITLTATLACLATARAAISVGPAGSGVLTLDTAPAATEFAAAGVTGGGTTFLTVDQVDAAIQQIDQSAINGTMVNSATTPPSTSNAGFRYNTTLHVIQSRPTGDAGVVLKATLQNDTGGNVSALAINYDFAQQSPAASVSDLPGHIVYFSLSGAPGTWTRIDALSDGSEASGPRSAIVPLGNWAAGTPMYIVWVDDNADAITDPSYTIDNISFTPSTTADFVRITSPTNTAIFPQGAPITINAAAALQNGVASVSFFDGATLIGSDSTSPYSVVWTGGSVGGHTLTAVTSDGIGGSATSDPISITIQPNTPPVISAITNNYGTTVELVGTNLTYTAVVTDDGAVTNVEFQVDGISRRIDTTAAFTFGWVDIGAGAHTITVIATDNSGASSTSTASLVVTNPPNVDVLLANEQVWKYYDEGFAPDPAWMFPAYDDSSWSNGVAQIGWGDADERTVSRRIVGTPGDPSAITNASQAFRKHFTVANPSAYTEIDLRVLHDDGAIVYINGTEVYRSTNMLAHPTAIAWDTFALGTMYNDGFIFTSTNIAISSSQLVPGDNVIAIQVVQNNAGSTDLSFDAMIFGVKPTGARLTIVRLSPDSPEGEIRWAGTGTLEYTEAIGSGVWTQIPGPYPQAGGENVVPLDLSAGNLFFRVVQ